MPAYTQIFASVVAQARRILTGGKGSHDWEHTERVLALVMRIGRRSRANLDVVRFAAVLHDIGRREEDRSRGRLDHAVLGAQQARKILGRHCLGPTFVEAVCHCIETHRFRGGRRPVTLEARVLFDADKLDSIGAVGIGRAFLFAGEVGARLHNRDVDVAKTKAYTEDDTAYREYMVKLRKVKGRMLSREGKRLARERHAFMVEFFRRLDREVSGAM